MYHPKLNEFKRRLKAMLDEVDHELEERWGDRYDLHPARPERGETANPQADGLFTIGADFTAGFGSRHGRGYLIDVRIATLEAVEAAARREIYEQATRSIKRLLPLHFPERSLEVVRDGEHFKITGDFSLGSV